LELIIIAESFNVALELEEDGPAIDSQTNSNMLYCFSMLQVGLAQMLKGGVIMDVVTPEEARIAEEAGAVAVMALERVPADIRKEGGVARMSDPQVR
jgi:pyridoxal 5'-phosphate synthase pdxS subunit